MWKVALVCDVYFLKCIRECFLFADGPSDRLRTLSLGFKIYRESMLDITFSSEVTLKGLFQSTILFCEILSEKYVGLDV